MGGPKGNRFWEARSRHGRKPDFNNPEMLEEACQDYFDWVENNPLYETKPFAYEGAVSLEEIPKPRPMTFGGLCLFLDISQETWASYRQQDSFLGITRTVDHTIRTQKFVGAATGFFNANIIARDLGLKDTKEVDHKSSDGSMSPADAPLTKQEAQELLANNK